MLSFQRVRPLGEVLPGLTIAALENESGAAKFELSLELAEADEEVAGRRRRIIAALAEQHQGRVRES